MSEPVATWVRTTKFEVIRRYFWLWQVDRVKLIDGVERDRYEVRWFYTQKRAEQCAEGLAFRTWTRDGAIVASYDLVEPVEAGSTTDA